MRAGALSQQHAPSFPDQPSSSSPLGDDHAVGDGASESSARLVLVQSVTTAATLAHERTLPVVPELAAMVPSGHLQRGSNLAVHGAGATSFALALVGQAVRDGSFMAIVANESFGLAGCLDFDIPLRRVVQFVLPSEPTWGQAVAAVIEGFDVVLLADRHRVTASQGRQLAARARERGSVLVRVGGQAWADAADLRFDVGAPRWIGVGQGHGHLQSRQVGVQVAGRRYHGSPRAHQLQLPALTGGVQVAPEQVAPLARVAAERAAKPAAAFAGSDIDAMLDAVQRSDSQTRSTNLRPAL